MKYFKLKISLSSIVIFSICIILYYLFFVFIEKQSPKYCELHYCLPLLEIGDFIACSLAVIGLVVVVVSLDAWKSGQQYIERREFILDTKLILLEIKDDFFKNYVFEPVYDHLAFLSITAKSGEAIKNLKKLQINSGKIGKFENHRQAFLSLVSAQVIRPTSTGDIDIGRECAFLLSSISDCIQEVDEMIEKEALAFS